MDATERLSLLEVTVGMRFAWKSEICDPLGGAGPEESGWDDGTPTGLARLGRHRLGEGEKIFNLFFFPRQCKIGLLQTQGFV